MGGECETDCIYDTPAADCAFEDAAFCASISSICNDPTNSDCMAAVEAYCCTGDVCTQDYGCKQEFFEMGGMCNMKMCPTTGATAGIYACPFNDPYICGQFAMGSCKGTTVSTTTGLPVFPTDMCKSTLRDYCCGDTNMTCPLTDMACKTTFFISGATCSPDYDYNNCHNGEGFYDYGPCNGFLPNAPFCNSQVCIDNPYSIGCAIGQILPYCCGNDKDSCNLDMQCRNLVFPLFNAPGTPPEMLKTTNVSFGPAPYQGLASKPCGYQCTWTNMTKSPTKAPSVPTKAPTTKSPTKAPKKSAASGISVFVSALALAIACLF